MEYFVQYHIYGKYGFPGHPSSDDERLSEATHVISSSKDYFLEESKGNIIFLILGIAVKKNQRKEYYLWSKNVLRSISHLKTKKLHEIPDTFKYNSFV